VNNLGFCLEILNNAIIAALVDISLPSNPKDMLCFMLSSTLICQVVYLLFFLSFSFSYNTAHIIIFWLSHHYISVFKLATCEYFRFVPKNLE
jgi:hypothetical protein